MRLFTDPSAIEALPAAALPQPPAKRASDTAADTAATHYRYLQGDRICDPKDGILSTDFRVGQNVWVCLSKGGRQQDTRTDESSLTESTPSASGDHRQERCKLFKRACVVESAPDDENHSERVTVRYPLGSTYRVRRSLLLHILDESVTAPSALGPLVLVFAETSDYRRACVVHTGPEEAFCEIGCAQGTTCQRVQHHGRPNRIVLGLDKSESEIQKAVLQVPNCTFVECDILRPVDEWSTAVVEAIRRGVHATEDSDVHRDDPISFQPVVVAIDINGNRELQAVLSCLQVVMDVWHPRLVLVKSRSLYHGLGSKNNI